MISTSTPYIIYYYYIIKKLSLSKLNFFKPIYFKYLFRFIWKRHTKVLKIFG